MGDHATFVIEQDNDSAIYIYGHWAGDGMLNEFAHAIAHALPRIRMEDEVYTARMVFNYLTRDDVMGETGWGLSTYFCDSEHSVPVLNVKQGTVRLLPHSWDTKFDISAKPKFVMSVDNFIGKFAKVAA
jgi:hypothetical protein